MTDLDGGWTNGKIKHGCPRCTGCPCRACSQHKWMGGDDPWIRPRRKLARRWGEEGNFVEDYAEAALERGVKTTRA